MDERCGSVRFVWKNRAVNICVKIVGLTGGGILWIIERFAKYLKKILRSGENVRKVVKFG